MIPSKDTAKILSESLPEIIKNLHFPKRMKWDDTSFTFARPLRWICCLFGKDIVKFKIASIISDKYTYIKANSKLLKITVNTPQEYFSKLKKANIIIDHSERKKVLKSRIGKIASICNASVVDFNNELLKEVNFLVEAPAVFISSFDKGYLKLPKEVLLASMSKYQRVFGLVQDKNKLINKFIGVTDGKPCDLKVVSENYKMVLESRLKDSLFFFKQDTKTKLVDKVENLNHVIYHNMLGSMYDKLKRVNLLSKYIAKKINLDSKDLKNIDRACLLSKADLTTSMVSEFPSLQGVMGKIYALLDKEDKNVADAIYGHYLPRFSGDGLPKDKISAVISIADRIDSLVGYFGIGFVPTGSYDPYGLRRNAYAIIKLIICQEIHFGIDDAISESIKLFNKILTKPGSDIKTELLEFILDKVNSIFIDEFKPRQLVDGVLKIGFYDIFESYNKLKILDTIKSKDYFLKAAKLSERTMNIYKSADNVSCKVNPKLFKDPLEEKLWKTYKDNEYKIINAIKAKDYEEATKIYASTFFDILHSFFDNVLVNVEDSDLRNNRLALCKHIHDVYNLRVSELGLIENIKL